MHLQQFFLLATAATAATALAAPRVKKVTTRERTRVEKRDSCSPNTAGVSGYDYSPDTGDAFAAYSGFADTANSAATPAGYVSVFTDLHASNNAADYRGYTLLDSYDPAACAQSCSSHFDCQAFNILFERDPSVGPGPGCDNPSSVTYIKCVLWAGPVSTDNAVNVGFTNDQFEVLITGSNGYISSGIADPAGYTGRQYFGSAAISDPADQVGDTSYQGTFDASKCADECTGHTNWAADKPTEKPCNFFNTYYQYVSDGSDIEGQICVMYSKTLDSSYATNVGQYRGNGDHVLVADSYGWSVASS